MSTSPPTPERPERPFATFPTPGNAEFLVYLAASALAAIAAWLGDETGVGFWLEFFKWATAAYLISRGIAKASRVFEY